MGNLLSVFLLIDVSGYGIKDWAQLVAAGVGITVGIFGLYKTLRYSKSQIATRLKEYLEDEEAKIKASRNEIIRSLRQHTPLNGSSHPFHQSVKEILVKQSSGQAQEAERMLERFDEILRSDVQLGNKFVENANLQLATVCLVRGKTAFDSDKQSAAGKAWKQALDLNPTDPEAERYLGELALASARVKDARTHFFRAYSFAPDDKLLRAETWEQLADFYRDQGRPRMELPALQESASNYSDAGLCAKAATAYARAGELAVDRKLLRAPELLRQAFGSYQSCGNDEGMRMMRQKMIDLGEDVSEFADVREPLRRRVPWTQLRYAAEAAILAAAGVLFYVSLR